MGCPPAWTPSSASAAPGSPRVSGSVSRWPGRCWPPTANLDPATADALTRDLLAATTGRSTLLITHHLTGLDAVDEILVLDHGQVVQRGTHAELLRTGGPYRDLLIR